MCGRLTLFTPQAALEERFDATASEPIEPRYNVAPRDDLAAIRNDAPDAIDALEWGLLPAWADDPDDAPRPINARAETVAEKPTFREAFRERRCLVLADGFYEWAGARGSKQPHRVALPGDEPFAMAGLWERWSSNGTTLETATVITTEPNAEVRPLHDRMAVVLEPGEEDAWLAGDDPGALLDPYPDGELRAYPVSTAVNDPSNDRPSLSEEADVGSQSGLGDFS